MTKDALNENLIEVLSKEYQSIWIIDIKDHSMQIFKADEEKMAPHSADKVIELNTYDKAQQWYVDNVVMESQRAKVRQQTTIDHILSMTATGTPYNVEYERLINGEINFNQLCYDSIRNENNEVEYITLGFRDIDIRKKSEIDDLTGLLTRQAFFEKAEELLRNHPDEQYDIILSDIIDFKKINENYGVKTADNVLRWNGSLISPLLSEDILAGRYGGDQMVILGTHEAISGDSSKYILTKYVNERGNNGLPDIVMKFGVYNNIPHDHSVVSSCDKAHIALNSIKHHYVKAVAFYDEHFKDMLDKQRRIENSMYESLKNGDFKVYYQPKHDAKTGRLMGAEALIRWIHPEYGFMSPADFIPLFEKNGFIVENDKFVWKRTCENLRKWTDAGIKTVPISVNASKLTMSNIDLVEDMLKPVHEYKISPTQLHIEITETLMSENLEELINKLNAIRKVGFEIELDDFGSGFSSINILSTLPLDIVKLDMSFMQQFGDEKRSKVLAACINLAKELGFKTVSEGVELREQNDVLGTLGVDMIQGYLYSKPLPEEEFEKYLIENIA